MAYQQTHAQTHDVHDITATETSDPLVTWSMTHAHRQTHDIPEYISDAINSDTASELCLPYMCYVTHLMHRMLPHTRTHASTQHVQHMCHRITHTLHHMLMLCACGTIGSIHMMLCAEWYAYHANVLDHTHVMTWYQHAMTCTAPSPRVYQSLLSYIDAVTCVIPTRTTTSTPTSTPTSTSTSTSTRIPILTSDVKQQLRTLVATIHLRMYMATQVCHMVHVACCMLHVAYDV